MRSGGNQIYRLDSSAGRPRQVSVLLVRVLLPGKPGHARTQVPDPKRLNTKLRHSLWRLTELTALAIQGYQHNYHREDMIKKYPNAAEEEYLHGLSVMCTLCFRS